jgi:hypothetical protein
MPASDRGYCVVGVFYPHAPDSVQLVAIDGKVLVWSTVEEARNVAPRLGAGRLEHWSADRETICWTPLYRQGFNRASILTGYDPYDVPNGFRRMGIWSEAEGREWRSHILWTNVARELLDWADAQGDQEPGGLVVKEC